MTERLLRRWGHHYILLMMIFTRGYGVVGGLLVVYYVELSQRLPNPIRLHFWVIAGMVVALGCTISVLLGMWETRNLRVVLRQIRAGEPLDPAQAEKAGREAVLLPSRHHRQEAWFVPCTTLVPCLVILKVWHDISLAVMENITAACFMAIVLAVMSHFFATERSIQPVIRYLLDHGVFIDYKSLPVAKLRFRLNLCFTLLIMTAALMVGTLARQRTTDIIEQPEHQAEAVASLRSHSSYITIAAMITGFVFSTVLAKSIASRANNLVQAMGRVRCGNLSERVQPTGNDEIDILGRQFNEMVQQLQHNDHTIRDLNTNLERKVTERTRQLERTVNELQKTQTQLTDVAHHAGMAEIATGVLHNVGNVLNSVNMSATTLSSRLRSSRLNHLKRLTDRLTQDNEELRNLVDSHGRGEKLREYMGKLSARLMGEREDLLKEVEFLTEKVEHIRSIINSQQNYARRVPFREQVELATLVRDILEMHGPSFTKHGIRVACDFADVSPAHLEKSKLVQVLDNLIKNAAESMADARCVNRVLTIRIEPYGPDTARIVVSDCGQGIAPENLEMIFTYGFTTKPKGNGFGLHSAALAISSIGGTIQVHSDGLGTGAKFTVELPLGDKEDPAHGDRHREEILKV